MNYHPRVSTIHPDGARVSIEYTMNENRLIRIAWQTATMPAPAFEYVKTEDEARGFRKAFDRFHGEGKLT